MVINKLILLWCICNDLAVTCNVTRRQYQAYRFGLHNLFTLPRSPGAVDMLHIEKSLNDSQIVVELAKKVSTRNLFIALQKLNNDELRTMACST